MKCPIDQTTLLLADRQGVEIDYCPTCRGVWLDRKELDEIIRRMQENGSPAAAPVQAPAQAQQYVQQQQQQPAQPRRYSDDDDDDNDNNYRQNDHQNGHHEKHKKKSPFSELFDF